MMIFNLLIFHMRVQVVVTSTKDKYRNHTEALKNAKIFIEPDGCQPKVLYK